MRGVASIQESFQGTAFDPEWGTMVMVDSERVPAW